ncbi:MAG: alpha-1,2-fucosyltransferase, partial [Pseudomonadota bacterium]
ATVVKCTLNNIDGWFFLQHLLSNTNTIYELNKTYQIPIVSVNIMGGLGNQMFQLASSYAYAKNNNAKLLVLKNKKQDDGRSLYWDTILYRFQNFLVDTIPEKLEQWVEPGATEFGIIPPLTNKGLYLSGYLQSPKYFRDNVVQQELKHLFKPSPQVLDIIQNKYKILLDNKNNVVVVHARRTDYLKNQHMIDFHGPLPIEYYTKAINNISQNIKNPMYLLVSDDPSFWVSVINESKELSNKFIFILDDENDVNTLGLLQQFQYFIIANSIFSWWAAWLSENTKKVIAPSKWFGPLGHQNYKDIYMPLWELI